MAELTRRGLELILEQYPTPQDNHESWTLPLISGLGWKGLSDEDLKVLAQQTEAEVQLTRKAAHQR